MGKVFISYSREDKLIVSALVRELQNNKIDIWIDQKHIDAGSHWDDSIQWAIDSCSHLLLILSKASTISNYVRDEFIYAKRKNKKILVAIINDVELPLALGRIQYIDFRDNYDTSLQKLVNILKETTIPIQTNLLPNLEISFPDNLVSTDRLSIIFPDDKNTSSEQLYAYPVLRFEANGMNPRAWEMRHSKISIGRSSNCDITLSSSRISRNHLNIFADNTAYFIQDKSSTNGTWINRQRLNHNIHKLKHNDIINVAHTVIIRFMSASHPSEIPTDNF
jgi:TIR domain/FHA domain